MNFYIFILVKEGAGGGGEVALMHVYCMGTHSQPLLQNHLIDVYETWY